MARARMRLSFRARLSLIVATTAAAFALMIAIGAVTAEKQTRDLNDLRSRLVPKLQLGPKLDAEFERLRLGFQNAVAAQDAAALDESREKKDRLIGLIRSAGTAISARDAELLRSAIDAYYERAYAVSRQMIEGETGEGLVHSISEMQNRHQYAAGLIERVARLDHTELTRGFESVQHATDSTSRQRLWIGLGCLTLVLGLSFWFGRGALRALQTLSEGLSRFATGRFDQPIVIETEDEIGNVAGAANRMAENLARLAAQRDLGDWLKTGLAGLSDQLRGEHSLKDAAERSLRFLARYVNASVGVIYLSDEASALCPVARYAFSEAEDSAGAALTFRPGQGLVGEAARSAEILVLNEPPSNYLRIRSGLGETQPSAVVLVPLTRAKVTTGVIELALLGPCTDAVRELLESVREMLAISFDMVKSRVALRELLERTQAQAERLTVQEELLRTSNQELSMQQEELRQSNEELEAQRRILREQNLELEQARERLVQKADELTRVSSYKSQFLANMSHELRTPLNSMLLLSHILAENEARNLTAKQVEHSRTIHSAGKDLLALINQVLDLAKIESGKQELVLEKVAIEQFAHHARNTFGAVASHKGLKFSVHVASDLPEAILTDRHRVERVLTNLIGNAIKFTEVGEVSLRIGRFAPDPSTRDLGLSEGPTLAFAVTDSGIGIAPEAQERIFAPFEQAESRTDRRYGGTGLGLSIARESAALLGGSLVLSSVPGRGSRFTLLLPETPPESDELKRSRPAKARELGASLAWDDWGSLRAEEPYLLIIEDDSVFAEQLVEIVHARGFKVLLAQSGMEGLELAKQRKPHGIILDVNLPDINGWAVMERLRQHDSTREIPVHFISGVDASERALALGAVGYLTKPATRTELVSVVQGLMRPTATLSCAVLVVEDDISMGESLVALLTSEGIEAEHVTSGGAALQRVEQARFGCIVLDLGLPDMDGLGLLELLESRLKDQVPSIVVHTARALTREETRRIEAYAEAVVLKDGSSQQRLLDEIRLFVEHVRASLPRPRGLTTTEVSPNVSLENKLLLLADDDMRTVYAISALLRGKGAEVLIAATGREALEVLSQQPNVHGVLMDVMMPDMDGYEAMRALRREARFERLPVIALTAKAMRGERERCIEAGASDYLAKPVDPAKLLELLERWVNVGVHGAAE